MGEENYFLVFTIPFSIPSCMGYISLYIFSRPRWYEGELSLVYVGDATMRRLSALRRQYRVDTDIVKFLLDKLERYDY